MMDMIPRPSSAATISSRASSRASRQSDRGLAAHQQAVLPTPTSTPSQSRIFEACTATASFFIYAQRNVVLCLHHDTLAIDRRFTGHVDDVVWIEADNSSERGAGKMVASYDNSMMTIIWDVLSGQEIARVEPYGDIRVAAWMKNGQVAFGNSQGNITLFDPYTSENMTFRTINDPITALAPASDNQTFAIGFLNGTVMIANIHPFQTLHLLNTGRSSPINCLGWHGSSSKQKSDMLAAQLMDGDLRVWSIPKVANGDRPTVIRNLFQGQYDRLSAPCWFSWSKLGRIVQFMDGNTYVWDVRTKRVTQESVPTVDGVVGIANYAPHAVLFTVGRNHTVQQYDLNPSGIPQVVRNVQHVPGAVPPSPPFSEGARGLTAANLARRQNVPLDTASSEGEGDGESYMSPLQRIAHDVDPPSMRRKESRDMDVPLSPGSSRSSNVSSSKGDAYLKAGRRTPQYPSRYERSHSSRLRPQSPATFSTGLKTPSTVFSTTSSVASGRRPGSSRIRQEVMRDPGEQFDLDLFSHIKMGLSHVQFRPPQYDGQRTAERLRLEMLRCVFGWDGDIDGLIRWEMQQHPPQSAAFNLLSKWLGDVGPDTANMIGSESMTSHDWMLLALNNVDKDSQKKVGEVFVQRLLEKGDIHPAVAILLGLGETQEAIEIYVSRQDYLEALLLTCLLTPNDWQRISHLVREWGGHVVTKKNNLQRDTDLAVRCFACATAETSEPWFSPAAKDAVYMAQMQLMGPDQPSPASATSPGGSRRAPFASLQPLITNFSGNSNAGPNTAREGKTPMIGMTPIDGDNTYNGRFREPMSSITATPGGMTSRRMTSRDRGADIYTPIATTRTAKPMSAVRMRREESNDRGRDAIRLGEPMSSLKEHMPSPSPGAFFTSNKSSRLRNGSRARKPDDLILDTSELVVVDPSLSSSVTTTTHASSVRIRGIDEYVSSVDGAGIQGRRRPESRTTDRGVSRGRAASESARTRYIRPSKPSPSSPISMSPDDPAVRAERMARGQQSESEAERFYRVSSPIESRTGRESTTGRRTSSRAGMRRESVDRSGRTPSRPASRNRQRAESRHASSPDRERRGRSRMAGSESPGSAQLEEPPLNPGGRRSRDQSIGARVRSRGASTTRGGATSPDRATRQRSLSAQPGGGERGESPPRRRQMSRSRMPRLQTNFSGQSDDMKQRLAAQELAARRKSLAKKASQSIMHPHEYMSSPGYPDHEIQRSRTADPEYASRMVGKSPGGASVTSVGLPSNPRAMRRGSSMTMEGDGDVPAVPQIPDAHVVHQQPSNELLMLPAVSFQPPVRIGSAPPDRYPEGRKDSLGGGSSLRPSMHGRMGSITGMIMSDSQQNQPPPPPPAAHIMELSDGPAVLGSDIFIVAEPETDVDEPHIPQATVLNQLQYLADAQPAQQQPRARKSSVGVINIVIDDTTPAATPVPMLAEQQQQQQMIAQQQQNSNSLSNKIRNVRERMRDRSSSRQRNNSPPSNARNNFTRSPYESIPEARGDFRVGSAPPGAMHQQHYATEPAPMNNVLFNSNTFPPAEVPQPLPSLGGGGLGGGLTLLPAKTYVPDRPATVAPQQQQQQQHLQQQQASLPSTTAGYRTPKEIARAMAAQQQQQQQQQPTLAAAVYRNSNAVRANMPPSSTQAGAMPGGMF